MSNILNMKVLFWLTHCKSFVHGETVVFHAVHHFSRGEYLRFNDKMPLLSISAKELAGSALNGSSMKQGWLKLVFIINWNPESSILISLASKLWIPLTVSFISSTGWPSVPISYSKFDNSEIWALYFGPIPFVSACTTHCDTSQWKIIYLNNLGLAFDKWTIGE